jgi:pimeloyl-ACP methyl ester carboxylesterase
MEQIDLGVCPAYYFEGSGRGTAIVLPGAGYPVEGPLLWFTRDVLNALGRSVVAVRDTFSGGLDARDWVEQRTLAAFAHLGEQARPLIVGKSISTLAVPMAVERGWAAVWLTPLLNLDRWPKATVIVEALRRAQAPSLLVGGSADPAWDAALARSVARGEVLEIEGADHSLQIPGDPLRSLENLRTYVTTLRDFAGRLAE